jgi:hypothetical protein
VLAMPPDWKVFRVRAPPYIKLYCERNRAGGPAVASAAENALLEGVKIGTLGLGPLVYGLMAHMFFKSSLSVPGVPPVTVHFFYDVHAYEAGFRPSK